MAAAEILPPPVIQLLNEFKSSSSLGKKRILQGYFFAGTYGSGVPGLITGSLANDS